MTIELFSLFVGFMLFSYWINYCMGTPLASHERDIDVEAILFFIPYLLAVRKLKRFHLWEEIDKQWRDELNLTDGARSVNQAKKEHVRAVYVTGREFFTWEKGLLCPVCFHFWISLIGWSFFVHDFVGWSALFYLITHLIIRKI